ncbi:MAG: beta-propeller fold lactonase family protein [Kouleothrix sp.]
MASPAHSWRARRHIHPDDTAERRRLACHLCLDVKWPLANCIRHSGSVRVSQLVPMAHWAKPPTIMCNTGAAAPNAQRQEGPHAHSATLMPDGEQLLVADLSATS